MKVEAFTVHNVAKALDDAGIKVVSKYESPDPDFEDDSLELGNDLHVQVGETYLCLSKTLKGDVFHMWPYVNDTDELIEHIREAREVKA